MKPKEHTRLLPPLLAVPSQSRTSARAPSLLSGLCLPDVSLSTFSLSPGHSRAYGRGELLAGQPQERSLCFRKRARVCLSSPQDNNSHVANLLWLQLLHSGGVYVSSPLPALVGCSNFYHTLKAKSYFASITEEHAVKLPLQSSECAVTSAWAEPAGPPGVNLTSNSHA